MKNRISVFFFIAFLFLIMGLNRLPKKRFSFASRVLIGSGAGLASGGFVLLADTAFGGVKADMGNWFGLFWTIYIAMFRVVLLPSIFIATVHTILHTPAKPENGKLDKWKRRVNTAMVALASLAGAGAGILILSKKMAWLPPNPAFEPGAAAMGAGLPYSVLDAFCAVLGLEKSAVSMMGSVAVVLFLAWLSGNGARRMSGKYMEKVKPVFDLTDAGMSVATSALKTVIAYKPSGAAAIMAGFTVRYGMDGLVSIGWFLVILCLTCVVMFVVQTGLAAIHGVSPLRFIRCVLPAVKEAIRTRSGAACLGLVQKILAEDLKLQRGLTDEASAFTARSGMQGCAACFPSLAVVYALSLAGVAVTPGLVVFIVVLAVLASYGIAGLPGTATISEFAVMLGISMEGYAGYLGPMIAVDPIADVPRTVLNVTGCITNAIIVERRVRT